MGSLKLALQHQLRKCMRLLFFSFCTIINICSAFSAEISSKKISPDILAYLNNASISEKEKDFWNYLKDNCSRFTIAGFDDFPLDWKKPEQGKFTYFFEHIKNPLSQQTVIYLHGGPGGAGTFATLFGLESYNVIKIDPRGLGCNYLSEEHLPSNLITTEQTARDIVELIRRLGLRDYVIFGASYGTVLGTVLAKELENTELIPPKAILLQGVVGKMIGTHSNYVQSYVRLWNEFKQQNSFVPELISQQIIYPQTPESSGNLISSAFENSSDIFLKMMSLLQRLTSNLASEPEKATLDEYLKNIQTTYVEDSETVQILLNFGGFHRVLQVVLCSELSTDWYYHSFKFQDGNLVPTLKTGWPSENRCLGMSLHSPYDSKRFQLKIPIYYINGTTDPQTPFESAMYHFQNQSSASFTFFQKVTGHGHNPFKSSLKSCAEKIWSNIFNVEPLSMSVSAEGACL